MKDIWKALIIAFLLFLIPLIWYAVTKGGLIRALGGVTREEAVFKDKEIYILADRIHPLYRVSADSDVRADRTLTQHTPESYRWVIRDIPSIK